MPIIPLELYLPFLGLIVGAILPPTFFARDWVSVLVLNLFGLIIFMLSTGMLAAWGMASDLPEEQRTTPEEYLKVMLGLALTFLAIEALIWLLRAVVLGMRHLIRRFKTSRSRQQA